MDTSSLVDNFKRFVTNNLIECRDGSGGVVQYIPISKLNAYWEERKVREILESHHRGPIFQNAETIRNQYTIVFSILVYISQPHFINHCVSRSRTDQVLPLETRPGNWPTDPASLSIYNDFYEHQWKFCPLNFEIEGAFHRRDLDARQVIPVDYVKRLSQCAGDGDIAIVWKVKIHDSCNTLVHKGKHVVFKVYQTEEARDLFSNEVDTYVTLPSASFAHIVTYLGSFEQNRKFTVILEYAEGGSLLDFFKKNQIPMDKDELVQFWTHILDLLVGLNCIHAISKPVGVIEWVLEGIHNDIQPANILVFPSESGRLYESHFKLADFGTSHISKRLARDKNPHSKDNNGNRIYTAPECCPLYEIQDTIRSNVEPSADVWAIGAVFSETLVWTIQGEVGRETYRKCRVEATSKIGILKGSGYDACFHTGSERLSIVEEIHQKVLRERRFTDTISPHISDLILDHMLLPQQKGRLSAILTYHTGNRKIDKGKKEAPPSPDPVSPPPEVTSSPLHLIRPDRSFTTSEAKPRYQNGNTLQSPGLRNSCDAANAVMDPSEPSGHIRNASDRIPVSLSANSPPYSSFPQQPSPAPVGEPSTGKKHRQLRSPTVDLEIKQGQQLNGGTRKVTIERVYGLLQKKNKCLFGGHEELTRKILTLPGIPEACSEIRSVAGREQFILVDDYTSMKEHKLKVTFAARVLSYYVKKSDPNKIELSFASDLISHKFAKSRLIEDAVTNHDFVEGTCNMSRCLDDFLQPIYDTFLRKYQPKRVSIYILTDGVWQPNDSGVDKVIVRTVEKLRQAKLSPHWVMFQFVRFGDNPTGKNRLKYLDDDIVKEFDLGDYDIVDTRRFEDPVPDILIGSISSYRDKT